jgi:hypothetical protein
MSTFIIGCTDEQLKVIMTMKFLCPVLQRAKYGNFHVVKVEPPHKLIEEIVNLMVPVSGIKIWTDAFINLMRDIDHLQSYITLYKLSQ